MGDNFFCMAKPNKMSCKKATEIYLIVIIYNLVVHNVCTPKMSACLFVIAT